ncbi:MAG: arginase family protein, partial [Promethearchaeota archaeon]
SSILSTKTLTSLSLILLFSSFPIFLGGDHSITIPLVSAFSQTSPINFVMLDAHADLLDIFLDYRIGHANVLRRILEFENVHEVFLIGTRSLEKEELDMLSHPKINVWTVDEFHEHDLSRILSIIPNTRTYLSLDIDVVDPAFAPGTGIPDPGGITSYELLTLVREIMTQINVVGMDIVEYAPAQDVVADITGFLCVKTIFEALTGLKKRNFKSK